MLNQIGWHAISFLGNAKLLIPLSLLVALLLYWRRRKKEALLLPVIFYGGVLLNHALKQWFKLPRPPDSPIGGYGFPSGHAMNAAVFYVLMLLLFAGRIKSRRAKYAFILANALLIALVALSRVMLHVHYARDVLGGVLFGLLWVGLWCLAYHRLKLTSQISGEKFK